MKDFKLVDDREEEIRRYVSSRKSQEDFAVVPTSARNDAERFE